MAHKKRIMYIEKKLDGVAAEWARVGWVTASKTGSTLYYGDLKLFTLAGGLGKANYFDEETHDLYWVSGCKKDGSDGLYSVRVEIDEDVREEYWTEIRKKPELKNKTSFHSSGKYSK